MANKIEFRITGKDDFSRAMKGVGTTMAQVQGQMGGMVKGVLNLKTAIVGLAAAAGGTMLAKSFVDAASTTENLRVRLSTLLGSVEEGNALFQSMSQYASEVPFQYEEIMGAATQLAGVMEGGVSQVEEWMPLIGDLAAASGLSIQQTTEQVIRMYSAGAASADLFRERGITAMLGFQAGVSYSAEETREMLIKAWEDPASKFRDASAELATTWTGLMSMMGDKWFQFRTAVMDAGLFDFFKAIAIVLNDWVADSMEGSVNIATRMADGIISAIKGILSTIGFLQDAWRVGEIAIQGFAIGATYALYGINEAVEFLAGLFEDFFNGVNAGANFLISGINRVVEALGGEMIPLLQEVDFTSGLEAEGDKMKAWIEEAKMDLQELTDAPWPSETIAQFVSEVEVEYEHLRNVSQLTANTMKEDFKAATQETNETMSTALEGRYERLSQALLSERELMQVKYAEDLALLHEALNNNLMSEEQFAAQVEATHAKHQSKLYKDKETGLKSRYMINNKYLSMEQNAMASAFNQMLGEGARYSKTAFNLNKAANISNAITSTYAGAAKALEWGWPLGPVFAASIVAAGLANVANIAGQSFSGQADNGMSYVPYAGTYMLARGERIVSPEQNRDLTNALNNEGVNGGPVTIENIQIDVLPNATNATALMELSDLEWKELVADRIINSLNTLYRQGVYPVYAEQSNV